jgi:hypothetical protein
MYFNMANLAKICAAAYVAVVLVAPGVDAQGCTQCVTGFTNEVPPAIWAGSNCNKYDPEKVDWDALRDVCAMLALGMHLQYIRMRC